MIATPALLGYAACAAWFAPALLAPLTRRGTSVRVGLAAWLAAMTSVLASAALAVSFSLAAAVPDWARLTQTLCRSVAGGACTPEVYRSLLYQGGVAGLAALLAAGSVVALWRYGRRVQRSRARTRAHARTALLVGRAITGARTAADGAEAAGDGQAMGAAASAGAAGARTVMLDDPRPAAYCVAGRPAAIVVTSGALAVLDPAQLRAVLAHERAHLAHRHHALATVTRALAAALPGVPLFTRGAEEMARLAEMAADDSAARTSGRSALVAALLAMATGTAFSGTGFSGRGFSATGLSDAGLPGRAMAAADQAVPDRVERLLRPAGRARSAACTAALSCALTVLAAAPPALTFLVSR